MLCSGYNIRLRKLACLPGIGLRIAACQGYDRRGQSFPRPAESCQRTAVPGGGNCTGVYHHRIGLFFLVRDLKTCLTKKLLHALGLIVIHLAAKSYKIYLIHNSP